MIAEFTPHVILPPKELANVLIIAGLLAPIWLPLIRFGISLFRPKKSKLRAYVWCYAVAFIWAAGWVSFQWVIRVPSGIGYGLALISAWLVMLPGIAADPLFRREWE
jgi:hypothetical protein